MSQQEPGIFRVTSLPMTVWLVETDAMARSAEPVLSLVSRVFLREHQSIIEELAHAGHSGLTWYAAQLVHQIHTHREDFAVPVGLVDEFAKLDEKMVRDFIATLPDEWRVGGLTSEDVLRVMSPEDVLRVMSPEDVLRVMSPEDVLRVMSPEDVLRVMSPEDVLRVMSPEKLAAAMSDEQAARLRDLLDRRKRG